MVRWDMARREMARWDTVRRDGEVEHGNKGHGEEGGSCGDRPQGNTKKLMHVVVMNAVVGAVERRLQSARVLV